MVGFIQILIYMMCVYFIFKGVEIFQIGLMGAPENRKTGLMIGLAMVVLSIVVAIGFFVMEESYAEKFSKQTQQNPLMR